MDKNKHESLGSFLHKNSSKSNEEIADVIRSVKKVSNRYHNQIIFFEKKSIDGMCRKLNNVIKAFDDKAEVVIKTKNGKWQQD
jgi:hypothetical protein